MELLESGKYGPLDQDMGLWDVGERWSFPLCDSIGIYEQRIACFFPLFGSFLLVLQDHWQVFSKADFGSWVLHTFLLPAFSILFARQERIANAKPRKAPKEEKDTKEKDPEEKNGKEEAIAWVSTCLHDSKKISSPQPTASPVAKVQEEKEPEKEEEDSACGCHALRLQTRLLASALCSVQDQALPSLFDEAEHFPWGYQVIFLDPFGIESLLHNTSLVSFGASTIFYPPHSRSIWIFNEVEPRWATSANRGRHPWRRHDGSTSCAPLQYGWLDRSKAQRGAGPGGPWRALEGKAKAERPLLSAVVFCFFCFFCFFHFSSFARPWKILEKTSGGKEGATGGLYCTGCISYIILDVHNVCTMVLKVLKGFLVLRILDAGLLRFTVRQRNYTFQVPRWSRCMSSFIGSYTILTRCTGRHALCKVRQVVRPGWLPSKLCVESMWCVPAASYQLHPTTPCREHTGTGVFSTTA